MNEDPLVLFERRPDGVATVILNRPAKLNAFTVAMIDEWYRLVVEAIDDPSIRVIVLTGAGRAFCAGGDVDDILRVQDLDSIGRKDYLWRHVHKIPLAIKRSEKPIIAAVNGAARGAGLDMALMCDLRIVSASATFAESYINLGLIAGDGGTYYLPRLIGTARALELFWTGRVVTSQEAERIGLVNQVVADDNLMSAVYELAVKIASQPEEAIRAFRRAVYQGEAMSLEAHLDMISSHMSLLFDTLDHRNRVKSLLDRASANVG